MNLKRLWDTENKKIVWAIPTSEPYKKLQVWTNNDGSKLYVYRNSQYLELDTSNATVAEYGHYWKELDDEMVGYYLTPEPTNLYNRDEGDEVSYTFKDYDGTVLKTGKIEEGETPTAPADPTREATAQYTYAFAGWNPTVGPISKRTTYTATYTATVNQYTVSIESNNTDYGTVDESSVTVDYGTPISANGNVLTIGTGESVTVVTATAETNYGFSTWGELPSTVTEDITITATFVQTTATVSVSVMEGQELYGSVSAASATAEIGTQITASGNTVTIGESTITATANEGYEFTEWLIFAGTDDYVQAGDNLVLATFQEATPGE